MPPGHATASPATLNSSPSLHFYFSLQQQFCSPREACSLPGGWGAQPVFGDFAPFLPETQPPGSKFHSKAKREGAALGFALPLGLTLRPTQVMSSREPQLSQPRGGAGAPRQNSGVLCRGRRAPNMQTTGFTRPCPNPSVNRGTGQASCADPRPLR